MSGGRKGTSGLETATGKIAAGNHDIWMIGNTWGYIGIMEKQMQTTGIIGLYRGHKGSTHSMPTCETLHPHAHSLAGRQTFSRLRIQGIRS